MFSFAFFFKKLGKTHKGRLEFCCTKRTDKNGSPIWIIAALVFMTSIVEKITENKKMEMQIFGMLQMQVSIYFSEMFFYKYFNMY